jgi:hypothetical protein
VVYPNDHRPAHVHILGNGSEAVFDLHCPGGPIELRENYGFPRKDLVKIGGELAANLAALCSACQKTPVFPEMTLPKCRAGRGISAFQSLISVIFSGL